MGKLVRSLSVTGAMESILLVDDYLSYFAVDRMSHSGIKCHPENGQD